MADATGPDWTAITQAVSAVVQGVGVLVTLYLTYSLAKRSHDESRFQVVAQRRQLAHQQAISALALLGFLKSTTAQISQAVSQKSLRDLVANREVLTVLIARANAAPLDAFSPDMAHAYLDAVRFAVRCLAYIEEGDPYVVLDGLDIVVSDLNGAVDKFATASLAKTRDVESDAH